MKKQQVAVGASADQSQSVDKSLEEVAPQNKPLAVSSSTPNYIPSEFSMEEFRNWEERMEWNFVVPHEIMPFVELYREHDPWQASSDDVMRLRQELALKMETSKKSKDHDDQRSTLEDVERLSKIAVAKEEEVQNWLTIFKKVLKLELINSSWCSFP